MRILKALCAALRIGVASPQGRVLIPIAGIMADNYAMWGISGLTANVNAVVNDGYFPAATGTSVTNTVSAAALTAGIVNRTGTPAGAVADTTDTAQNIVQALPPTIPADGTYQFQIRYINNGLGQTITLSGGTGVTITGNNTLANNTIRDFLITVRPPQGTTAASVEMTNLGTKSL